jgi:hypothetical protein
MHSADKKSKHTVNTRFLDHGSLFEQTFQTRFTCVFVPFLRLKNRGHRKCEARSNKNIWKIFFLLIIVFKAL